MLEGDTIELRQERGHFRARDVSYFAGTWRNVRHLLPTFELTDFKVASDAPANPHMRTVVRLPRTRCEQPIPVGVVSPHYTLVQHTEVAERCFEGIRLAGIDPAPLRCEVGLTDLGEWMNLRVYFPDAHRYKVKRDTGDVMDLRVECFNSVDGSSRLVVLFSWFRLVCSNGLAITETVAELRDVHNRYLTLDPIADLVQEGLHKAAADVRRMQYWENTAVPQDKLAPWIDEDVSKAWGPKAACRVFHICGSGHDVDIADRFAGGRPSERRVARVREVPGSHVPARMLLHVAHALSWVATQRRNPEERVDWQRQVPQLVTSLSAAAAG